MEHDTLFGIGKMRIYNPHTPIPIHQISELDENTNRLGKMGAEICCEMNNTRRKKDFLLPYLTGLRMDYGWHLDRTTTLDMNSIGDVSRVFAVDENGVEDHALNYLKRFRIINEDGFWQMYLLYNAASVMPAWWHGCYVLRGYVFTLSDIKYLEYMPAEDKKMFSQRKLLLPKVIKRKNSANVKVTYWHDNEGLCRETVKITVNGDGRVISYKTVKREVLYQTCYRIDY